jgi:hypothetical protein
MERGKRGWGVPRIPPSGPLAGGLRQEVERAGGIQDGYIGQKCVGI